MLRKLSHVGGRNHNRIAGWFRTLNSDLLSDVRSLSNALVTYLCKVRLLPVKQGPCQFFSVSGECL